jgi:hypothetical protein
MKDEIDALNAFSLSLSNTHSTLLFFLCDMEVGKKGRDRQNLFFFGPRRKP